MIHSQRNRNGLGFRTDGQRDCSLVQSDRCVGCHIDAHPECRSFAVAGQCVGLIQRTADLIDIKRRLPRDEMPDAFIVGCGQRGRRAVFADVSQKELFKLYGDTRRQVCGHPDTVTECGDMIGQKLKAGIHVPCGMQDRLAGFFDFGIGVNPFIGGENLIVHVVLRYSCK